MMRIVIANSMATLASLFFPAWICSQEPPTAETSSTLSADSAPAGNEKVAEIFRTFGGRGAQRDDSLPTPPDEMLSRLRLRNDVEADLIANEPEISQPLFLSWDSRGRMWVVQYRQYQYPAGLKVERFDQYLRAVFDKVPEPPPNGPLGADRITVLEDTDGDGLYDRHEDVITGLNIATSVQVGPKGIWVLNPPYLLHYPDQNGDGRPDGKPEVHLSGFGLQDTHSVANSLIWGPDGWLYGANGSTTAGTVSSEVTKGVRFEGQCIWRYSPKTKEFEIFAEGGGNTFSAEIDSKGRVFSGTNGGNKRGYHYPQGSYADKNWGKHGPLTNPYAFGYFTGMPMEGDTRRFAQAFTIYEGGLFGPDMQGSVIAPNSLHNLVWNSELLPDGSTYRTRDRGNLVETDDRWFRPVYAGVGPDGAIYLADWYDTRLSHVNPVDDWHKDSGRIYRVRPKGTHPVYEGGDLTSQPSKTLIENFAHPNKWIRRRSALELGWRADTAVQDQLISLVSEQGSLESLWALNLSDAITKPIAENWISHSSPHIRRWTIRLLGDRREASSQMAELAKTERDPQVRAQLASTAKRVDARSGLAIIQNLAGDKSDLSDRHLPLLCWWAVEEHSDNWPAVETFLRDKTVWMRPLMRQIILPRLMQRYAASGKSEDLDRASQLIALAPGESDRDRLLQGLTAAFEGRAIPELPERLANALQQYQESRGQDGVVLAIRSGNKEVTAEALAIVNDESADLGLRTELIKAFGQTKNPKALETLLRTATARTTRNPAIQRVSLVTLANYSDAKIAPTLIGSFYGKISREHGLRDAACRTLASRAPWADRLLDEVTGWRMKPTEVPQDVIQRLRTYDAPALASKVEEAFGKAVTVTAAEKIAEIKRLSQMLTQSEGHADRGQKLYEEKCGNCHRLFGKGNTIGPPLDGYQRDDIKFWLNAIVEPSLEIREGYQSFQALTHDGRVVTGMMAAQDPNTVTLRTADDRRIVLTRNDLELLEPMKTSLMPEQQFKEMSDMQIADLFAFLMLGTGR